MNPDSLASWLAFLEARRPEHQMMLGLERAGQVARHLLPAEFFSSARKTRIITIGGTNGKGSTVATLSAILKAAGLSFGAWTSPHITRFNERICINGEMVSDAEICDAFGRLEAARGDTFLSYYEFGTLAALDIFARAEVDVILLEVGLGGRLDTVNILDADVSAVVTVDLDHQAWLGDTIEEIAREKAGIFRAGCPAVCGEAEPAQSLLSVIEDLGATALLRDHAFGTGPDSSSGQMDFYATQPDGDRRTLSQLSIPELPLPSVLCALQALVWLFPALPEEIFREGLQQARLSGRCQKLVATNSRGEPVTVILDVAHNPQAARYLAQKVGHPDQPALAVFGMLNDKNARAVIEPLRHCFRRWHVASVAYQERARSGSELVTELSRAGEPAICHETVGLAIQAALEEAGENDTLVVFGSFHTVGEALAVLGGEPV